MNRHGYMPTGVGSTHGAQRGSVLIISLMMMVLMTLLSVTAMRTTVVEQKMAGNQRDMTIALQSAEGALRNAEAYVESLAAITAFNGGVVGLYTAEDLIDPLDSTTWTSANSRAYDGEMTDASTVPRYIIELVKEGEGESLTISNYGESTGDESVHTFRITARATGKTSNSYVYLQEHYGRAM